MAKKKIDCSELSKVIFKLAEYHATDPDVKNIDDVVAKMKERLPNIDRQRVVDSIVEATQGNATVRTDLQKKLSELKREAKGDKTLRKAITELENALQGKKRPKKEPAPKKADPKAIRELKKKRDDLAKKVEALENPEGLQSLAREYAQAFIASGVVDRESLLTAVHKELAEFIPSITRRAVMDAISGYGNFTELDKTPEKVLMRDLNAQYQQLSKLEDMAAGQAPKRTGMERQEPSDETRRLKQQVEERKKEGGYVVTDPAKQLRTSLDAIKRRLKNQISDLDQQIKTREQIVKERKPSPTDAEVESLRTRRDELRKEYDSIFKRGMSDEQRTAAAIRSTQKSIAEYERRLQERDFSKRQHRETPVTPELEAMRQKRDALKEQYDAENPNRPNLERMRERLVMLDHHVQNGTLPRPYQRKLDESPEAIQLREALGNVQDALKRQPQFIKKKYQDQIAEYERKWAERDFAPSSPKPDPLLSAELEKLRYERDSLRKRQRNAIRDMRPRVLRDQIADVGGFARAWLTSLDLSGLLRQGGFIAFGNPKLAAGTLKPMFQALVSKQKAHAIEQEILNRPNAWKYDRSGLYLSTEDSSLSHMEEAYMTTFLDKMREKLPYEPLSFLAEASARAYTTVLNRMRADAFDMLTETLAKNSDPTLEEMQAIAHYINIATGRGDLGAAEQAGPLLNATLFAPRYVASRFQLLAMPARLATNTGKFKATPQVRKLLAKEYAKYLIGIGTVYALAHLAWGNDDDDETGTTFDMRTSDFGKIRIGNTRIDPLSGLSQSVVLIGRVASGQRKSPSGKVTDLWGPDKPFRGDGVYETLTDFLRTKFSPQVAIPLNIASREDAIGRPTTPGKELGGIVVPLAFKDVRKAIEENGVPAGTALSLLSLFGVGVQVYGDD